MQGIPPTVEYERSVAKPQSRGAWWRLPLIFVCIHATALGLICLSALTDHSDGGFAFAGGVVLIFLIDMPVTFGLMSMQSGPVEGPAAFVEDPVWLILASAWWFFLGYVAYRVVQWWRGWRRRAKDTT